MTAPACARVFRGRRPYAGALLAAVIALSACDGRPPDPSGAEAAAAPASDRHDDSGQVRTHYLAADEGTWDYAPLGMNAVTGEPFDADADVFVANGPDRIGHVYRKARFREYTDESFQTLAPTPPRWRHLGLLGPVLHAEVGDTLRVVFRNNARLPFSVHPHGVFYAKDSEGAPYADGTSGADKADDAVPPGGTHEYVWQVPERAGPGPMDGSSVMWMYHSHVNETGDTYAGLMGPIVVTARGEARADGSPRDVDRELVTSFHVVDENQSPYLAENIATFAGQPDLVDPDDADFQESNLMHSINGFVFGNLPGLDLRLGERVRWYVMAMGTEVDLHTPHWHGNTVLVEGMSADAVALLPATMLVADMVPDDAGTWLYHCHVNDHILAGMQALYTVAP